MNKVDYTREWRRAHPENVKEHNRRHYLKNKEQILIACTKWRNAHLEQMKSYQQEWWQARGAELRFAVLEKFGAACRACRITDARVLCIDHVHGGGKKELSSMSRSAYLKKVLADTEGNYQILCHNCNWIKRHEEGEVRGVRPVLE